MSVPCHHCGRPVIEDGPAGGVCPACLWRIADEPTVMISSPVTGLPEVTGHVILSEIARGGMGVVYKAKQLDPEREVALKMLLPLDETRDDLLQRFRVEVHALAELDHPGILPLYQVGSTGGRPWFTMKLATGGTLATRLNRRRKPFEPREAAQLISSMADAVQHAHSHGFLHRDIKPANILFDERGDAFLGDFGLAKLLDSTGHVTRSLAVLGTPCYMAPEVASAGAKAATTASDIYGLGAVLYELLSGRPPFIVEGMAALVKKIVEDEPDRPSTLAANVPRDLELVCLTCLAKDPRQRYATAKDAADDLRRWLRGEPVAARRAGTAARLWSWARRRPAVASLGAALILAVLGGGTSLAILNVQKSRALREKEAALARADSQSEFLIGKFTDELEKVGRLNLILEACEEAAKHDSASDDAGCLRRARLLKRWSSALLAKGDSERAVTRLRQAVDILEALAGRTPLNKDAFKLAVEVRCLLAEALADSTSFSEAVALLDQADARVSSPGILALDDTLRLQAEVDRTRALIWTRHSRDESETTIAAANRAVASFNNWQSRDSSDRARILSHARALREAGKAWYNGSGEHPDPPNLENALPLFSQGARLMRGLTDRSPVEELELAYAVGWMGDCLLRMEGQGPDAAEPLLKEEFDIASDLVRRDPLNGEWQFKLANCHLSLAALERATAKLKSAAGDTAGATASESAAAEHQDECHRILEALHRESPDVRNWAMNYLYALRREAMQAKSKGDAAGAAKLLNLCSEVADARVTAMPGSITEREGWRNVTDQIGELIKEQGEPGTGAAVYRRACDIAQRYAVRPDAGQEWWQWTLSHFQLKLASATQDAEARTEWMKHHLPVLLARAAEAGQRAAAHPESIPECSYWKNLTDDAGKACEDSGNPPQALSLYRNARDLARRTAPLAGAERPWWEWTLAHYHRRVAAACKIAGLTAEWLSENVAALDIRAGLFDNRASPALKDPAAVANSFLTTINAFLASGQQENALSKARHCLELCLKHRAVAGALYKWAEPVIAACGACRNVESLGLTSSQLAAKAAASLYPPDARTLLGEKDRAAADELDRLAAPPAR